MPSIGDVFLRLALEGTQLEVDARKQGAKAGEAAGTAMAVGIQGKLSNLFKVGLFAGAGIELGRQALIGLEGAIAGVIDAIPNMIEGGKQFALLVDDIADKTGASAETASRFAGSLQYLGISTAGLGLQLKTLSTEIVNSEAKLNKLGIATRDSNGNLLDTVTVLNNLRGYLSGAEDGAAKLTIATQLLGRGAGQLIDFLNLTDAQAAALNSTLDDLGVTMGEEARHNAEDLAREQNLLSLAFQGFSNLLFTEVAPTVRAVVGGITEFIKTHGAEIRATIVSMTQAVLGFIEGLLGLSGITPFQNQLDALDSSAGNVTLSFEQWAQQTGRTIPAQDKLKTSTKGTTDAIDKQIDSTQRAIDVEKRRDDASETIFQRTMKRLSGEYQAQLDALDLAEKQIAIADRQRDLNDQLNAAQLDLGKAQGGTDAQAVSDAMAKVADIQAQQAENERRLAVDSQRERLQATQDYIDSIAKLEADNDDKKSLANTLRKRDDKLTSELAVATAAKDADRIKDITAKLEAVKTAEERTAAALRSKSKADELAVLKSQLEEQRKAIAAAGSGQVSDNAKTLAKLKTQYATYLDGQITATKDHVGLMENLIGGDPAKGTGLGGAITKAFTDGQAAGEGFRTFITDDLIPAIQVLLDVFTGIKDKIDEIANSDVWKLLNQPIGLPGTVGPHALPNGANDIGNNFWKGFQRLFGFLPEGVTIYDAQGTKAGPRERAAGGPVNAGMPYLVGERGPEVFRPERDGVIIPRGKHPKEKLHSGEDDPFQTFVDWFFGTGSHATHGGTEPWSGYIYETTGISKGDWLAGKRPGLTGGYRHMAEGGPVAAGKPYLVGEDRPEIFVPSERDTIIPSVAAMGNWTAASPIEIHTHVDLDGREIARSTSRILADEFHH